MSSKESFVDRAKEILERGSEPQSPDEYIDELERLLKEAITLIDPVDNDDTPYDSILAIYHLRCPRMPKVLKLSPKRKGYVRRRWKEDGQGSLAFWHKYFERAGKCDTLNGGMSNGWCADFEWLINPSNMLKVLEGRYDRRSMPIRANPEQAQNDFLASVRYEQQQRLSK